MIKVLDLSAFQELFEDEADFQEEILTLFLEETPKKLERMQQAYASGDMHTVSQIAHSLKSPFSTLGGTAMMEMVTKLEHNSDLEPAMLRQVLDELTNSLSQGYKEVRVALQQLSA
ncbi:MAG: Hpt domain-containing protein [Bacteroidia bacterium]